MIENLLANPVDKWLAGNYYVSVKSSNVIQIRYDRSQGALWVQYNGIAYNIRRPYYKYLGISETTAREFYLAPSQGIYLAHGIKMGPFRGPYATDDQTGNPTQLQ